MEIEANGMKLIGHLLPTKDASNVFLMGGTLFEGKKMKDYTNQYIYLTSDREIKGTNDTGTWAYCENDLISYGNPLSKRNCGHCDKCQRIEFTNDPKLIADGVPALPEKIDVGCGEFDRINQVNFLSEFVSRYNNRNVKGVDVEKLTEKDFADIIVQLELKKLSLVKCVEAVYKLHNQALQSNDKQKGVDVEKLPSIEEVEIRLHKEIENRPRVIPFILAKETAKWLINKIQALQSNDKMFSLKELRIAIGFDKGFTSNSNNKIKDTLMSEKDFIQSLTKEQPNGVEMWCEMEKNSKGDIADGGEDYLIKKKKGQPIIHFNK